MNFPSTCAGQDPPVPCCKTVRSFTLCYLSDHGHSLVFRIIQSTSSKGASVVENEGYSARLRLNNLTLRLKIRQYFTVGN